MKTKIFKDLGKQRLETLTDGVFAIIMTILVLEVKVPQMSGDITNEVLAEVLLGEWPLIVSFFASFAILGTYWMAHNFIFQNYVRKMDRVLGYLNMLFLIMASMIPFSAHFVGVFYEFSTAITLYAVNIILIGLALFVMRRYILLRDDLRSPGIDKRDIDHGTIRIFLPPVFALISIAVSQFNTSVSLLLFTVPVLFNMVPGGLLFIEEYLFAHIKSKLPR